jgi:hypothetical protein
MTPDREKEIGDTLDRLLLSGSVESARHEALLACLEVLAQRAGVVALDGLTLRQWITQDVKTRLAKKMIALEDVHPGTAARLQQLLEETEAGADGTKK